MKHRHLVIAVFVTVLGAVLTLAFRGVGRQLPELFPNLARERREVSLPLALQQDDDVGDGTSSEPQTPQAAIPLKLSGELPNDDSSSGDSGDGSFSSARLKHAGRTGRRLVAATPIPRILGAPRQISESFEVPPELEAIVNFWKKVYGVYDSDHVVLHDTDHLEIEYGVLDFSDLSRRGLSDSEKKSIRDSEISSATSRIKGILDELDHWEGVAPLSDEVRKISQLFRHIPDSDKFKKAKEAIRTQTGLKNRFEEGLRHSGRYMAYFEDIFQSYGLPKEIARLPFVESLFRERAMSKVGAAGLWQFMPDTARRYMTVNNLVDERYDPLMATHAAARLLLKNKELLGTWPLAINAYNSGPGNLLKAISALGTRDIGTIVTRFRSGSYAFASRNFFPSFLAALDVAEHPEKYFGHVIKERPMEFDLVELPGTMAFPEVAYYAGSTMAEIQGLNPAFSPAVFQGDFSIPAGTQIRVPRGGQQLFASRFIQHYTGAEASNFHVIQNGENLPEIAARYGLTPQDLQRVNATEELRSGRVLMIPSLSSLVKNSLSE